MLEFIMFVSFICFMVGITLTVSTINDDKHKHKYGFTVIISLIIFCISARHLDNTKECTDLITYNEQIERYDMYFLAKEHSKDGIITVKDCTEMTYTIKNKIKQ